MLCASRRLAACALAALGSALALPACDTAPALPPLLPEPPAIAAFFLTPAAFTLPGDAAEAQIPLGLSVEVADPAGNGVEVRYYVRRQGADDLVAEGVMAPALDDTYAATTTLTLPRGATGLYAVTVLATDPEGRIGDRAVGTIRFEHEPLGGPLITGVEFPEIVTRPATFEVVVEVTDLDGLENLAVVELRTSTGQAFPMRDDGGGNTGSGDDAAGDGRFTVALGIGEGSPPGAYAFTVFARDVEGQEAELPISVTVE